MNEFMCQQALQDPKVFKSKSDPDILHYHQAIQAADREQFRKSVKEEMDAHMTHDHWQFTPKSQVPSRHTILPAIWVFENRRITTSDIYTIHGAKQTKGSHYDEGYSPVVTWSSMLLTDFSGNWEPASAMTDPSTARSRSAYIITFADVL